MNPFLKKYFFLNLFLWFSIFSQISGQEVKLSNSRPIIDVLSNGKPLLYHASFKVFKYNFTGLIVFKYLSPEDGTRIVLLSEAGLSIAELSFINGEVEFLRTLPMVDRNSAKKYLAEIIQSVLTPADCNKTKVQEKEERSNFICKGKNGKHYYLYSENSLLEEVWYKKGLRRKSVGQFNDGDIAQKVMIQKWGRTKVELKIVENAIK